ncbi:MAG: AAA family ATPase [Anaerolineaceae bacterium]|nr:AAA family ATPase [Anaerolineaceae bacterium]
MKPIFLIVGPPAVGKSTTSRALAACFSKSIHMPVDDLRMMVVSGLLLPGPVWSDELAQQIALARQSAAEAALIYHRTGFGVVIDDFWDAEHLNDYQALLGHPHFHKVVLYPRQEAAHQRNRQRAEGSPELAYIDEGIEIVYRQLNASAARLAEDGWVVVDTSALSVDETVAAILQASNLGDFLTI